MPTCCSQKAPNAALGNLVSKLAKLIGNDIAGKLGGEIISTEELKHDIDDVNAKIERTWEHDKMMARMKKTTRRKGKPTAIKDREKLIVFVMDMVVLFPSIKKDKLRRL